MPNRKCSLWRGWTSVMYIILSVCVILRSVLETYGGALQAEKYSRIACYVFGVLMALCAIKYLVEKSKNGAKGAGIGWNITAVIFGIVGVGSTYVCSTIHADYALAEQTRALAWGAGGVVLVIVTICTTRKKKDFLRTVVGLGAIGAFMKVLRILAGERVLLAAEHISSGAGNAAAQETLMISGIAGAAMLLACAAVAKGAFTCLKPDPDLW